MSTPTKRSDFRNPDGTYDGVAFMAAISGLSTAEVKWTFDRLRHLMVIEKRDKEDAKAIVWEEVKTKPWETKPCSA